MKRIRPLHAGWLAMVVAGCNADLRHSGLPPADSPADQQPAFVDDGGGAGDDGGGRGAADPCGDATDQVSCHDTVFAPPFSLQFDANRNPLESDFGVNRDSDGFLILDSTHSVFNYLWIANSYDPLGGSVSRIESTSVREVARYRTTTCYSLKTGSTDLCDGTRGCCTIDDWYRYQARKLKMKEPGHQAVQLTSNDPSRTSVDFNGDLFISNRAFGGQSSVTKIANDVSECIDRNKNGKVDTSKDVNGDGLIEEDCNGDGAPDDLATVKAKPCTNTLAQEFYGHDDECILWTSNTFVNNAIGRPLGLAAGGHAIVSDAWAGSYQNGNFVRIGGSTGLDLDDTQLPKECTQGSGPYGMVVDAAGIAWSPDLGGPKLCYFDTQKSANVGSVRDPDWGTASAYGVTLDRDQNVWIGSFVARYTPDRSNGFKNLGSGWWTQILRPGGGRGIAADSRNRTDYFVWGCQSRLVNQVVVHYVLQIPASTIKVLKRDQQVDSTGWPEIDMPCYGVGVDSDQNIWGVDQSLSTRALVDSKGKITPPVVNGPPKGNNLCPAGDSCPNAGAYTYSDFTGFGLRNFTRPVGDYALIVPGCSDVNGNPTDTTWWQLNWEADVPANTSLIVHARSGNAPTLSDPSWRSNAFTIDAMASPLDLLQGLTPNATGNTGSPPANDAYLFVEFVFKTQSPSVSPRLKRFDVGFKCPSGPG